MNKLLFSKIDWIDMQSLINKYANEKKKKENKWKKMWINGYVKNASD